MARLLAPQAAAPEAVAEPSAAPAAPSSATAAPTAPAPQATAQVSEPVVPTQLVTSEGPVIRDLQDRLARAEREATELRTLHQQFEPLRRYVMEPGVIEAVERIRQGRGAPERAPAPPADDLPDEVVDWSRSQVETLISRTTDPLVQKIVQLEAELRRTAGEARTAQEEAALADKMGLKPGQLAEAKGRLQAMSSLQRAELLMTGYLAALPRSNVTVAPVASPPLPGPTGVSAGPAPTTPDRATEARNRFLSGFTTPREQRLAELKTVR